MKRTVVKSLIVIFSLLVPAAAVLYVCGGWVLGVVGANYAAGGLGVLSGVIARLLVGFGYAWVVANGVGCGVSGRCSMRRGGETILSRRTNSLIGEYHGTKSDTQG